MRKFIFLAVLSLSALLINAQGYIIGDEASDFRLKNIDGNFAQCLNKVLVLMPFCPSSEWRFDGSDNQKDVLHQCPLYLSIFYFAASTYQTLLPKTLSNFSMIQSAYAT